MKRTLLTIIIILAIAISGVGVTFANFQDIDISPDNIVGTGTLDIKVAVFDFNWQAHTGYNDDAPIGAGIDDCFYLTNIIPCNTYSSYVKLENTGTGEYCVAFLGFKIVEDESEVADDTFITLWYDIDGYNNDVELVGSYSLTELVAGGYWELGPLPGTDSSAQTIRKLKIDLDPCWDVGSASLEFRILFGLIQDGHCYSDPEGSRAYLECNNEGCTPGFWQGGIGTGDDEDFVVDTAEKGRWMWDEVSDPDWNANGATGTNPFIHDTEFNAFFNLYTVAGLDGLTMLELVETGGGPYWPQKAARHVVAAYLNASSGMAYPMSTSDVTDLWYEAVNGSTSFADVYDLLDKYNNLGCPFPICNPSP